MAKLMRPAATSDAARKTRGAAARRKRSRSIMTPADLLRFTVLLLFMCFAGTSIGNAAMAPNKSAPAKEIRIYNNTDETIYAVLQIGKRDTDEWIQAFVGVGPSEIKTRRWPSNKVYRIYVNGLDGIAPGHSAIITVPLLTYLVPRRQAIVGVDPDLIIDWWSGGRLSIYDQYGFDAYSKDYQADLATPGNPIVPKTYDDNLWPTCKEGDCKALDIFAGDAVLPGNDPDQLTEYTFADAITAKGAPYAFKEKSVGYNISSVDQLYLPLAMEPAGNPLIPYIGSVEDFAHFRATVAQWLNAHPGWPLYKGFDAAHPRIPEAHTIFLDGYLPDGNYNANGPLTAPGKDVEDMIKLYETCTGSTAPLTAICKKIQDVVALFDQNYQDYTKLACADPNFKNTIIEKLRRIYGWVPYNFGCGSGANALATTTGMTQEKFNQLQEEYISLQYNYKSKSEPNLFNPYVQLIHSKNYLDMAAYAFSIDDAIGFQHYRGTGLIYAVGGTTGLENPNKLDKSKVVNITYGQPTGIILWQSVGICRDTADSFDLEPDFPSFDLYPPQYPCRISALNANGQIYQFILTGAPPDPAVGCTGVTNPAWCAQVNIVPPNKVIGASTQ